MIGFGVNILLVNLLNDNYITLENNYVNKILLISSIITMLNYMNGRLKTNPKTKFYEKDTTNDCYICSPRFLLKY